METADQRKKDKAFSLWLACYSQQEIAEAVGFGQPAINEFVKNLQLITNGTSAENDNLSENPTLTSEPDREFEEEEEDSNSLGVYKLDKRLYRTTHQTFEDYCQERFGFDRRYVNRQIFHSRMQELLGPRGPKTEKQARPLTALPNPDLFTLQKVSCVHSKPFPKPSVRPLAIHRAGGSPGPGYASRMSINASVFP